MTVAISNESDAALHDGSLTDLAGLAQFVLGEMGVDASVELSVTLVDEPEMTRLHEIYMGEPGPTDVLAFPMDEPDAGAGGSGDTALLGDVVLCPSVAATQAQDAGHDTAAELRLLCVHGVLHLLGYDHHEPAAEREMFGLQARLLGQYRTAAAP